MLETPRRLLAPSRPHVRSRLGDIVCGGGSAADADADAAGGEARSRGWKCKNFRAPKKRENIAAGRGREEEGRQKTELPFQQLRLRAFRCTPRALCLWCSSQTAPGNRGKKGRGRWGHMIRNGNKSGIYGQYILADFFWQASHPRRTRQASHLRGTAGAVVGRRGEQDRNGRSFLPPLATQHKEDLGRKRPPRHTTRLNSLPFPPFAKARSEKRTNEKGKRRTPLIFPAPYPLPSLRSAVWRLKGRGQDSSLRLILISFLKPALRWA